jgi:hypothetical protein
MKKEDKLMAFGGKQKNNATTRGYQFYNSNAVDPATLSMGWWNNYITIKINPMLPESEQTDNKIYDYENGVSIMLSKENIYAVLKGLARLKNKKKEFNNFAIENNQGIIIKIGNGEEYEDETGWYVAIFEEKSSYLYEFNRKDKNTILMFNFDEETNKAEKKINANVELDLFEKFLEYSLIFLTGGGTHMDNFINAYRISSLERNFEILKALSEDKLISERSSGRGRGFDSSSGTSINRKRRGSNSEEETSSRSSKKGKGKKGKKEEEIDDISEIERELLDEDDE